MSAILPKDGLHELHAGTADGEQVSWDGQPVTELCDSPHKNVRDDAAYTASLR